ncbi:MAG TPA: hypothetical protein IAD09_04925, partial [Candidatus Caccoplasma merdavium]|nr:hypothetical protein [Candidatus Caccoplasma merdavium]
MKTFAITPLPLIVTFLLLSLSSMTAASRSSAAPDDSTAVEQTFRLNVSFNDGGGRVIMGDSTLLPGNFSESVPEGVDLIFRPQPYNGFVLAEATLNGEPFVSSDGIFYRTS